MLHKAQEFFTMAAALQMTVGRAHEESVPSLVCCKYALVLKMVDHKDKADSSWIYSTKAMLEE